MKSKRIFVLLMAAVMIAASLGLAGCGAKTEAPAPTEAVAVVEEPAPTEEPVVEEEPVTAEEPAVAEAEEPALEEVSVDAAPVLEFSTTSYDGSAVDGSITAGKKLVMVNLWEPWCGPCVGEMGDLNKLYEEYKDKGFIILGVYYTEDGVEDVVKNLGINYPIIKGTEAFAQFETPYVPSTGFLDAEGKLIGEVIIGSHRYDDWKAMIEEYLG